MFRFITICVNAGSQIFLTIKQIASVKYGPLIFTHTQSSIVTFHTKVHGLNGVQSSNIHIVLLSLLTNAWPQWNLSCQLPLYKEFYSYETSTWPHATHLTKFSLLTALLLLLTNAWSQCNIQPTSPCKLFFCYSSQTSTWPQCNTARQTSPYKPFYCYFSQASACLNATHKTNINTPLSSWALMASLSDSGSGSCSG